MSKIAEEKALEAYPEDYAWVKCDNEDTNYTEIDDEGTKWLKVDINKEFRTVYAKCYSQVLQDLLKDASQYMFLSDEIGYAYACGCRKTMQGFMEKAEKFLSEKIQDYFWWNNEECFVEFDKEDCLERFKKLYEI